VKIGGYVPVSLCDYPCRVAAVVFTQGCNFRCPFCHNGHLLPDVPVADAPAWNEQDVLTRLAERSSRLGGVVISGGEPTLQRDLPDFIRRIRDLGLAVKLDTNGSRPQVLADLLGANLLDYVAMDIKAPWACYTRLTRVPRMAVAVRRSVRILAASGLPHEFRTTRVESLLSSADCTALTGQLPPSSVHKWQLFRPEHALDPALRGDRGGKTAAPQESGRFPAARPRS
jgi:pyruvate formate lyase activating enzyme